MRTATPQNTSASLYILIRTSAEQAKRFHPGHRAILIHAKRQFRKSVTANPNACRQNQRKRRPIAPLRKRQPLFQPLNPLAAQHASARRFPERQNQQQNGQRHEHPLANQRHASSPPLCSPQVKRKGEPAKTDSPESAIAYAFLATSTSLANAAASFTARSASTLRLRSTPAFFRPQMNLE